MKKLFPLLIVAAIAAVALWYFVIRKKAASVVARYDDRIPESIPG